MTVTETSTNRPRWLGDEAPPPDWPRLTFDLDIEVCVIGAGLAGLLVARELALRGTEVAVIEAGSPAWGASSRNCGVVAPGYALDIKELIARVGFDRARELWSLTQDGVERVRETVALADGLAAAPGLLQVSFDDAGESLIARLQTLNDFGVTVEGWQIERVREALRSDHFFHALHWPGAFGINAARYAAWLAEQAAQLGIRTFGDSPVIAVDGGGIRKRIVTPSARVRSSHVILAGNVHLGALQPRLAKTLAPVWRHVAVTAPLGERLGEAVRFPGAVVSDDGAEVFRIIGGDRLMWSRRRTAWNAGPGSGAPVRRRIRRVFPQFGDIAIDALWSGVDGQTIHGMPQVGQLQPGVWLASGFGGHGLANTAMAARLLASAILDCDDRWRMFDPFELVWAGGFGGRVASQAMMTSSRLAAAARGSLARYRERARYREKEREARLEAANSAGDTRE